MFRIVTDTSANLPTAYLQQEHITIIPFTFHADGDEQACLDLNTFDAKTFYAGSVYVSYRVRRACLHGHAEL